jgi:hypothetical protein
LAPTPIPHILQGIPLQIKHVNVTVDRPGFTFNPTNCSALKVSDAIATLKFAPKFSVSTSGKTYKAKGASLAVKLTYPCASFGTYANIAKVKVSPAKAAAKSPDHAAECLHRPGSTRTPRAARRRRAWGHARVITPILPVPWKAAPTWSHAAGRPE